MKVLPRLWPSLRSVWMGAGPMPPVLHRALSLLAMTVRLRLLPSLSPFAAFMHRTINVLAWGEHRGGMFVEIEGRATSGKKVVRSWHLVAEGDDGPLIPSMAAEAIVRRCLDDRRPQSGARAAATELELADYQILLARRAIVSGTRQSQPAHELTGELTAEGRASVERGSGLAARLIAALFGFPPAPQIFRCG